jgi:dTDP-glucose 4,6-dehydratase
MREQPGRRTVLITGAAGFIGPWVVKFFLSQSDFRVLALDKLTYAANLENLHLVIAECQAAGVDVASRYEFIHGDICDLSVKGLMESREARWLVNLAAESHVDRSFGSAQEFLRVSIQGVLNLLEIVLALPVEKAVFVDTDEIYGSIDRISGKEGDTWFALAQDETALRGHVRKYLFREGDPMLPGSPYSAAKAGGDLLVQSYFNSYKDARQTPFAVVRTCGTNTYGPLQNPEKLLPLAICSLVSPHKTPDSDHPGYSRRIPVYDRGLAVREWLHVEDHASALWTCLERGGPGKLYNVGSGLRCLNRDLLIAVFNAVKKYADTPCATLAEASFPANRIGHDLCYAADSSRLREELGWKPEHSNLEYEVEQLVKWYVDHADWWRPVWDSLAFELYWQSKYGAKSTEFGDGPFEFYTEAQWNRSLNDALL